MATLGASAMPAGSSGGDGEVEAGFAKLQGEDFEYYMQTYSIMLGRNSKKSTVDVDLSSLGGGMNISRHHARIFYDFQRRRFALDVIGKNGCLVEGVLHLPGNPPVKLDSQDLLQIGDKKFYFLLPTRSIFASAAAARHAPIIPPQMPPPSYVRTGRPRLSDFHDRSFEGDYGREGDDIGNGVSEGGMRGKLIKRNKKLSGESDIYGGHRHRINAEAIGTLGEESRSEIRSRGDRDMDNQHILQAEEKDVVSSVATVLSDLCGPGEWMPMAKLHTENSHGALFSDVFSVHFQPVI
ncbi:transcriptional activator FHA1 isoform X2 [Oryza brachyantha]|uniref:transcriptional activator FHA1 isoform X2 n=1 Tax=Oryza brachyantha TaxID=4533 RepID=UPI0007765F0E|nr:transcriptional activator FHA1 isoform X2 [Oryza brachyantha]